MTKINRLVLILTTILLLFVTGATAPAVAQISWWWGILPVIVVSLTTFYHMLIFWDVQMGIVQPSGWIGFKIMAPVLIAELLSVFTLVVVYVWNSQSVWHQMTLCFGFFLWFLASLLRFIEYVSIEKNSLIAEVSKN